MANENQFKLLVHMVKELPPEQKVELLEAIGMSRTGSAHQPDCYSYSGNRCICIPPASTWSHPDGVDEFLGETWEDLQERASRRIAAREARERG